MFDIAPTELLILMVVALVVIGPKDLPKVMRVVGHWVGKARGVARQFRSGFDEMVREAEFAEMEKKWAEDNARIMREHPMTGAPVAPERLAAEPPEEEGDADFAHSTPAEPVVAPVPLSPGEPPPVPAPSQPGDTEPADAGRSAAGR